MAEKNYGFFAGKISSVKKYMKENVFVSGKRKKHSFFEF